MSELEKKFYEWLMLNYCVPIKPEKIARDLAEIAEKEFDGRSFDTFIKLKEENTELKKQLAITKEKIIEVLEKYMDSYSGDVNIGYFKTIASEILGEDNENK